jgi:hypothetical protein
MPLPAASAPKDTSVPFPCQDHACGCRNAEQCWQHCCCFTPEQRWAWARNHDVQPPAFAEKPVGHGWSSPRQRDQQNCKPVQTHTLPQDKPGCCKAKDSGKGQQPKNKHNKVRWGPGWWALTCQGLGSFWAQTGPVLPATSGQTMNFPQPLIAHITHADEVAKFISLAPPAPPPRQTAI